MVKRPDYILIIQMVQKEALPQYVLMMRKTLTAIMPHPERCFMDRQLPYKADYENYIKESRVVICLRTLTLL